jgi:hypothetical protein
MWGDSMNITKKIYIGMLMVATSFGAMLPADANLYLGGDIFAMATGLENPVASTDVPLAEGNSGMALAAGVATAALAYAGYTYWKQYNTSDAETQTTVDASTQTDRAVDPATQTDECSTQDVGALIEKNSKQLTVCGVMLREMLRQLKMRKGAVTMPQDVTLEMSEDEAATTIQALWKGYAARKEFEQAMVDANNARNEERLEQLRNLAYLKKATERHKRLLNGEEMPEEDDCNYEEYCPGGEYNYKPFIG